MVPGRRVVELVLISCVMFIPKRRLLEALIIRLSAPLEGWAQVVCCFDGMMG